MTERPSLAFHCAECNLSFTTALITLERSIQHIGGSDDDMVCPLCQHTQLLVFGLDSDPAWSVPSEEMKASRAQRRAGRAENRVRLADNARAVWEADSDDLYPLDGDADDTPARPAPEGRSCPWGVTDDS